MRKTLSALLLVAASCSLLPGPVSGEDKGQAAIKETKAAMDKMHKQMTGMKMTGNPDQDFVMMMIPHHQGAVDMAQIELKYGTDPKLRKMAQTIVDSQKKEIAEMKAWQKAHPMKHH